MERGHRQFVSLGEAVCLVEVMALVACESRRERIPDSRQGVVGSAFARPCYAQSVPFLSMRASGVGH